MLSKRDRVAAADMLAAARRAIEYAATLTLEEFARDRMRIDAAMAAVMIVGEASKRISVEGRTSFPDVGWRALADIRQYVVHKYFLVDPTELHRAITETMVELVPVLERALLVSRDPSRGDGGLGV